MNFLPEEYKHIQSTWDPGVRVGIGFNSSCDGWDYYLNWTYIHHTQKEHISVPETFLKDDDFLNNMPALGQPILLNPWVNVAFGAYFDNLFLPFQNIRSQWKNTFNQIDFELGRKYWLSKCFTLRPFIGLRGAWTRTEFKINSSISRGVDISNSVIFIANRSASLLDFFKTKNWGVGILGGIQPNWFFCENVILYGNLDLALIWGQYKGIKQENYSNVNDSLIQDVPIHTENNYVNASCSKLSRMNTILDLGIGLRWEETWCCDRYRTALDLGWEHHIWFNYSYRNQLFGPIHATETVDFVTYQILGFNQFNQVVSDFGYGGFVLRARFDF